MKNVRFLLLLLLLLLANCAKPDQPTAPTPVTPVEEIEPADTATSPALETVPPVAATEETVEEPVSSFEPSFENAPCPFDIPTGADIECGYVVVPEDHNNPGGATIRLAIVIVKDQSEDHQPDPAILLSGGPGEKTVENAQGLINLFPHAHPNRDLIVFDQRGVGLSEPSLECPHWVDAQYDILDETDPLLAAETIFNALMECRDALVNEGHNLSAYNTTQSASDVNAIRLALGYDKVNLIGGSYGSFLAQEVARQYPEIIRSMVVFSVWPLQVNFFVESPLVTSNAVLDMLAACQADPDCSQAYPNLDDTLFETIEKLNEEPELISVTHVLTGEEYDVLLSGDRVFSTLVGLLYQTELIPMLPQAIYDVSNGDYDLIAQLLGVHLSLYGALSRGMEFSVICAEDMIGVDVGDLLENLDELPEALKGEDDTDLLMQYGIFAICEQWPVEMADTSFKDALVSNIPTLLLEGEFDPVTPTEFAQLLADNLSDSHLFEFPGIGHNIAVATDCSRQMIGGFFEDPSQAPSASCISEIDTGFNIRYEDPAGRYAVPLLPKWTTEDKQDFLSISNPEASIMAFVLVLDEDNFADASNAAWEIVDQDIHGETTANAQPCRGCAAADADRFAIIVYDTGNEEELVLAAAWIFEGKTYLIIFQTDPATLDDKSAQLNSMIMGFTISAMEAADDQADQDQ